MNEKIELASADKQNVFDIMDALKVEFERLLSLRDIPYVDALMASHNFHKLIIQDLADRSCDTKQAKELIFLTAKSTWDLAMDKCIKEAI